MPAPRSWICGLPLLALLLTLSAPGASRAAGLKIGDDETYLKIALLLQGWAAFSDEGAPDGESLDTDFYLRRMRILLFGQLNDKVKFFVETDNPNFGKQGDFSMNTFIQDAWVEFNLDPALQIDVGMLLAPFSHHGMQGAVTLHSLDYHAALIKYPQGSHKVWRDYGVMLRGLFLSDMLEYRLAILNGVHGGPADPRNPHDFPRLTGRLTFNLFDSESGPGTGGFFWDGIYLKKTDAGVVSTRKIASLGASIDWQKDLNVHRNVGVTDPAADDFVESRSDYWAVAADVFVDLPLSEDALLGLTGQVNFYYYDHGDRRSSLADPPSRSFYGIQGGGEYTGYGLMSEIGLRYDAYEALLSVDWFEATKADGDEGDYLAVYGGLNWWWLGHSTSLKLQAGAAKVADGDFGFVGILQTQLLF
jgi:hypothetical protein